MRLYKSRSLAIAACQAGHVKIGGQRVKPSRDVRPGEVITRSMIWQHLYDDNEQQTSNVVDVFIRHLRNKIDKGYDPPLILTRWGEGYLLRGDA